MSLIAFGCTNVDVSEKKAPPPLPVAEKKDDRPVIVAFGDSLTAGFGLDAGRSYPDVLQKMLAGDGYRYRVVNEGISGDTTSGGVSRVDTVLAHDPKIVILELGANDGLRGIPVSTTRANLDQMITQIKGSGAKVLLAGITLPRNYGIQYIDQFDKMYPELAKKHDVVLLPFLLEGVALNGQLMQPDALHPNAAGTRVVAKNVYGALKPLLRKE